MCTVNPLYKRLVAETSIFVVLLLVKSPSRLIILHASFVPHFSYPYLIIPHVLILLSEQSGRNVESKASLHFSEYTIVFLTGYIYVWKKPGHWLLFQSALMYCMYYLGIINAFLFTFQFHKGMEVITTGHGSLKQHEHKP